MRRFRAVLSLLAIGVVDAGCDDPFERTLPLDPNLPLTLRTTLDREALQVGESVRIQLEIVNAGPAITVEFPSTCQVSFEIRSVTGAVAAPAAICGLGLTYRRFPHGTETDVFYWYRRPDEPWTPPGEYQVVAGLGSPPLPASPPVRLMFP